jgi:hypothetical protein
LAGELFDGARTAPARTPLEGLTAEQLADVNARMSLSDYGRVRRAALSTSGNPALGLQLGGPASLGRYDVLGTLTCPPAAKRWPLPPIQRAHEAW